jgi:hypothetical protein
MKPKPFASLNHFTVPVAIALLDSFLLVFTAAKRPRGLGPRAGRAAKLLLSTDGKVEDRPEIAVALA